MEITIDDAIKVIKYERPIRPTSMYEMTKRDAFNTTIDTMRKYQKIEDIYYHQRGEALENSLRAVIEDGRYSDDD